MKRSVAILRPFAGMGSDYGISVPLQRSSSIPGPEPLDDALGRGEPTPGRPMLVSQARRERRCRTCSLPDVGNTTSLFNRLSLLSSRIRFVKPNGQAAVAHVNIS